MAVHETARLDHCVIRKTRLVKTLINPLVGDSPVVEPLHVLVLLVVASHAPANGDEVNVEADNDGVENAIHDGLDGLVAVASEPVNKEAKVENGKVESRVVVMHISDTSHDNKGKVMKEPAGKGVQCRVVNVVNLVLAEIVDTPLPSKDVPDNDKTSDSKGSGGTPVDERVTEKEVLDDIITPTAHTETDVKERPLPPLGSEVILLIRVGNQSVVGSHHSDVQVDEVVEEWGLVNTSLGGRDYMELA